MSPFEVLKLIVSNLERLKIPYMVVGSFASSAHGVPRSTLGADFIVDLKGQHVGGLEEAFSRDFYVDIGLVEHALRSKRSFNLIHLGTFFKADLFVLGESSFAREEFSRRRLQPLESGAEAQIYLATAEDTVLSKLDWYRRGGEASENQWRDIIGIIKTQGGRLGLDYLRKWAVELGVGDLLEQASKEAGKV
jgi:hypothetical protein